MPKAFALVCDVRFEVRLELKPVVEVQYGTDCACAADTPQSSASVTARTVAKPDWPEVMNIRAPMTCDETIKRRCREC